MTTQNLLHIVLLTGGDSPEREVSKHSSQSIYTALLENGYRVTVLDPAYGKHQLHKAEDYFLPKDHFPVHHKNYIEAFTNCLPPDTDLVFIGLHGKHGEDGTVQALLELLDIPYTGSGVLSSSLAMDKAMSKIIMKDHGVTVPEGFLIHKRNFRENEITQRIIDSVGFPCVIKPNDQGSTCGLTIVHDAAELPAAYDLCFDYSTAMVVEEFIAGRELTAGFLNHEVLPVLEIRPHHDIYDYECKYTTGMSDYLVPAPISDDITAEVQRQTAIACNSLGCTSYARADFRLSNENKVYCLEVNTLPGMTSTSLIPKMAAAMGISFPEVVKIIVENALK